MAAEQSDYMYKMFPPLVNSFRAMKLQLSCSDYYYSKFKLIHHVLLLHFCNEPLIIQNEKVRRINEKQKLCMEGEMFI